MGERLRGRGCRNVFKTPPPTFSLSCYVRGARVHMETPSFPLCVHSLLGTLVCHVHTDAGKQFNTLHAFYSFWLLCICFMTVLSVPSDKTGGVLYLRVSSLLCLFLIFVFTLHYTLIYEDSNLACLCNTILFSDLLFFPPPLWGTVMTAGKTCRLQSEWEVPGGAGRLASFTVNCKSLLRQSPAAGTHHPFFLWPFVAFHFNSLMEMSHPQIMFWW